MPQKDCHSISSLNTVWTMLILTPTCQYPSAVWKLQRQSDRCLPSEIQLETKGASLETILSPLRPPMSSSFYGWCSHFCKPGFDWCPLTPQPCPHGLSFLGRGYTKDFLQCLKSICWPIILSHIPNAKCMNPRKLHN